MTDTIEPAASARAAGSIAAMRMPELQALAAQLGVKGTSRMRKSDLVEAISAHTGGGKAAPARTRKTTPARAERATDAAGTEAGTAATGRSATAAAEQQTSGTKQTSGEQPAEPRARRRATRVAAEPAPAAQPDEQPAPERGDRVERGDRGGREKTSEARTADVLAGLEAALDSRTHAGEQRDDRARGENGDRRGRRSGNGSGRDSGTPRVDVTLPEGPTGGERQNERQSQNQGQKKNNGDQQRRDRQDGQRQQHDDRDDERGGRRRRSRDRYRDRDRNKRGRNQRGGQDTYEEVELTEDDVLVPVAGILDVLDSYAFVRTSGYLPGANDVYVPLGQVRRSGLRRGDAITGAVRAPREGEQPPQQGNRPNKANALVRLDTVNGMSPEQARQRPDFTKLTPLYPQDRLRLEHDPSKITPRVIDIVAPIGKGQRGLIVAPPKAGKTIIMQQIANAITANNPEVHLMVVLVDERPEEVTDMERTVKGEVIASTFDRPASDHTMVAELAIERAKRLVELGQDVVVLLDSLTRLSRAYNLAAPASGRILSGGVDASALYPPKRFFGAARNIEHGGSLTILASALVETGSKMDEVIFEEFKGTGNMELRLSRSLADKRIFPAVDVNASGTRREEVLISPDELKIVWKLRRVMGALDQQQAIELLLGKLRDTKSNVEFLLQVQNTTPGMGGKADS